MLPILLAVGPVKIYTFGVLLSAGFGYFVFVAWRRLRDLGLDQEKIVDLLIAVAFFGWLAARLGFLLSAGEDGGPVLADLVRSDRLPGLSFWGALGGGAVVVSAVVKRNRWDLWKVADELVLAVWPLVVLWQIGLFFSGTPVGRPTGAIWGLFFPGDLIRRQPVGLFSAGWTLLVGLTLMRAERLWRTWKWYRSGRPGLMALLYIWLILAGGFVLAFLQEFPVYYARLVYGSFFLGLVAVAAVLIYRAGFKISRPKNKRLSETRAAENI